MLCKEIRILEGLTPDEDNYMAEQIKKFKVKRDVTSSIHGATDAPAATVEMETIYHFPKVIYRSSSIKSDMSGKTKPIHKESSRRLTKTHIDDKKFNIKDNHALEITEENQKQDKVQANKEDKKHGQRRGSMYEIVSKADMLELTKICKICKECKGLASYCIKKGGRFGRATVCKSCSIVISRKYECGPSAVPRPTEKRCGNCKQILAANEFNTRGTRYLASYCRACHALYRMDIADWVAAKKKGQKCVDCGYDVDVRALDFAHIDRKNKYKNHKGNTVHLSNLGTIKRMEDELPKCKLQCKWCHRLETKLQIDALYPIPKDRTKLKPARRYKLIKQAFVNAEKMKRTACLRCHRKVELATCVCFDFDHRDPSSKMFEMGSAISLKSVKILAEEMVKCDLLCCICHYIKSIECGESGRSGHRAPKSKPSCV